MGDSAVDERDDSVDERDSDGEIFSYVKKNKRIHS